MSLPHAILTALLEKPSSGLELTRRFDRSIGYFWSATHQQIYRDLGRLEESGLIRALPAAQATRGRKKEYEVLPQGRDELVAWVARREEPKQVRDPLLLRLRAAAIVGTDSLLPELRRHLALHERQLADYLAMEERDLKRAKGAEEDRVRHLILRGGIELERFWVGWLTEALDGLAAADGGAHPDAPEARGS
ncbi:PadR family transcriptional regulator [Streptomyces sp. NPDC060194]|uniref:PadR family transcriptional regulator n=1 Tax=Streptomyces sp. NPDC060194 TaxID=3347069 RepID=UPI0036571491